MNGNKIKVNSALGDMRKTDAGRVVGDRLLRANDIATHAEMPLGVALSRRRQGQAKTTA